MKMISKWFVLAVSFFLFVPCFAQQPKQVEIRIIDPRPEDIGSIDGMMKAFYEVVSGPAGQPRDWARDRTLYMPNLRFVDTGTKQVWISDHQEYVNVVNDYLVKGGFFEKEIHRNVARFGNIAHVWSTYESRNTSDGPVIARGINSVELYFDGKRWWISSASWDQERPDNPIPKEFLP